MSPATTIRHNQGLFVAAVASIFLFGGMLSCHLTHAAKKQLITTAIPIVEAAATAAPAPWKDIALGIISLLSSGTMIDNRRKDVLIKRLKNESTNHLQLITRLTCPTNVT